MTSPLLRLVCVSKGWVCVINFRLHLSFFVSTNSKGSWAKSRGLRDLVRSRTVCSATGKAGQTRRANAPSRQNQAIKADEPQRRIQSDNRSPDTSLNSRKQNMREALFSSCGADVKVGLNMRLGPSEAGFHLSTSLFKSWNYSWTIDAANHRLHRQQEGKLRWWWWL